MSKLALLLSSLLLIVFLMFPHDVHAATIFEDNFNSYADGSFPTKWVNFQSNCNTNWRVEGGVLKITISQNGCGMHLIPNSSEWPTLKEKYIFEADVRFISGVDSHLSYRINPQTSFIHVLHFIIPGDFALDADNQNYSVYIGKSFNYNLTYHFKIIVNSNRIQIYVSDINNPTLTLIRDLTFNSPLPDGLIGLGSSPGSSVTTETWFDNVKVTTIDDDSKLSVPLFKQTDPQWENNLYDSANVWASPEPSDISRWGCAMTSAAMIFQYHGITKLPDGTDLNPGTLNSWLKSQSDGYIGNGFVNWNALSRLSKQAKPQNPNFAYDTLENKRYAADKTQLALDLQNKIPDILEVPGHFVVATGSDSANTTFFINDPFYDKSTLASYSGNLKSIRSFIPSNSDLSYITFATGKGVSLNLKNSQDYTVGDSYLQDPIEEAGHLGHFNGPVLRMLDYPKPNSGNYTLTVSSPTVQVYDIDGYFYDKNGNVKKIKIKGIVGPSDTDNFTLIFDKNNSSVDTSSQSVTWDSFIQDINSLCKSNDIKIPTCPTIQIQATVAKSLGSGKAVKKAVHELLVTIDKEIVKGKSVSENAFIILHTDIQMLINIL